MTETFTIIPASSKVFLVLIPMAVLFVALLALFGYITYSSRHVQFEVDDDALHLRGDLYGRKISLSHLKLAEARVVNLNENDPLRPVLRKNGAGMPGYSSGWFRLRNGEEALLFVTDRKSVIYVPTSEGYSLLLSVIEPNQFLASLRAHAKAT